MMIYRSALGGPSRKKAGPARSGLLKEEGCDGSRVRIGAPKGSPGPVIDYLESAVKKMTEDPEFHQIMKDIVHPVLYRDRKAFLKNMQDGFDMYGKLIKELNLKLE
jgi:tripartite-type tricarboxylate transporter receptor subunit TctC